MKPLSQFRILSKVLLLLLYYVGHTKYYVGGYMVGNNPYHRAETLDPEGKYLLKWLVDWEGKRVTFNVTVETKGYVGFGLSSYGKMSGADIVIGGVNPDGSSYFSDQHAIGHHTPEVDPSQDWVLHSARESKTHTFLSFSRAFDTCDPQDYPITEDKISLLWAYGERDDLRYHYLNRGQYPIYLINPDYSPKIIRGEPGTDLLKIEGEGHSETKVWTINSRLELQGDETTYWCIFHKAPRLSQKHHAIGLNVRFPNPEMARYAHHLVLNKCHAPAGSSDREMFEKWLSYGGQSCISEPIMGPMPTQYCSDLSYTWGAGGRIFFQPDNIGIPFGESPDEFYMVQLHYNNPERESGIVVESEIEIFYTSKLREFEAGIFGIRHGVPGLPTSLLVPPSSVDHKAYGMCGSSCTGSFLPPEGITIYGLYLHSHNAGARMKVQHFRGNKELPWIISDDTYQSDFQNTRVLNRPVRVLPGDHLVTTCEYDNARTNGSVVGGYSSQMEMCSAQLLHHTKLPGVRLCTSQIDSPNYREYFLGVTNFTWQASRLEFVVDSPPRLAGLTISEVADHHVNWDLERREGLQKYQLSHPQLNTCPTEPFANDDNIDDSVYGATYPVEAIPYRPRKSCSFHQSKQLA